MGLTPKQTAWALYGLSFLTFAVGLTMTILDGQILQRFNGHGNSASPLDPPIFQPSDPDGNTLSFHYAYEYPENPLLGGTRAVVVAGVIAILASPLTVWAAMRVTHVPTPMWFTLLRIFTIMALFVSSFAWTFSWVEFYRLPALAIDPINDIVKDAYTPRDVNPESWACGFPRLVWNHAVDEEGMAEQCRSAEAARVLTLPLAVLQALVVVGLTLLRKALLALEVQRSAKAEVGLGIA